MANIGSIVQQMRYHCVLYYIYLLTCDILLTYHLCAGRTLLSGIPFSVVEYIAPQFLLVIESIPCCCSGLHLFSSVYWHFPYNCMQLDNYSCLITQCYWITRSIMKSPFHPKMFLLPAHCLLGKVARTAQSKRRYTWWCMSLSCVYVRSQYDPHPFQPSRVLLLLLFLLYQFVTADVCSAMYKQVVLTDVWCSCPFPI